MTTDHFKDFPFEELRDPNGNYFATVRHAKEAGYDDDQIWSVVESNGSFSYGPNHHYVNLLGYVATRERHDGATYYHEEAYSDEEA